MKAALLLVALIAGCSVPGAAEISEDAEQQQKAPHVLYVSFERAELRAAEFDSAPFGLTGVAPHLLLPFDVPGIDNANVFQHIKSFFYPFAERLIVTRKRPIEGEFTMINISASRSSDDLLDIWQRWGRAEEDCGNENPSNIAVVYAGTIVEMLSSLEQPPSSEAVELQIALTAVHEAGHTYGLGHVEDRSAIMHPGPVIVDGIYDESEGAQRDWTTAMLAENEGCGKDGVQDAIALLEETFAREPAEPMMKAGQPEYCEDVLKGTYTCLPNIDPTRVYACKHPGGDPDQVHTWDEPNPDAAWSKLWDCWDGKECAIVSGNPQCLEPCRLGYRRVGSICLPADGPIPM